MRTQLTTKELAEQLLYHFTEEDWDYDWDEEPFSWGNYDVWRTSDGKEFTDYDEALEHECWWLKQRVDEKG